MRRITDRATLQQQYADEGRLEQRRSVWQPAADGRDPATLALAAITAARPGDILEVGCGTGAFASRVAAALPAARLVATDQSERFVQMAGEQGVVAERADVQALPYADGSFDVVAAMWMLYHVPDLDTGLAEIRRVLRPGGVCVAVTNGDAHLATLMSEAGGEPLVTGFSRENGAAALARHFADVRREDVDTRAVFASHAQAVAYLATFDEGLSAALPPFDGPREHVGAGTVFVGRT